MEKDIANWNNIAKNVWKKSQKQQWFHDYILIPQIKSLLLNSCSNVLDYGCGSGELSVLRNSLNITYSGFDPSKSMIESAKIKFPKAEFSNTLSDFAGKKFDGIISNMVFPSIKNIYHPVTDINNLLNTNGYLCVTISHPFFGLISSSHKTTKRIWVNDVKVADELLLYYSNPIQRVYWSGDNYFSHYYYRTLSDYSKIFTENGFTIENLLEPKPISQGVCIPELFEMYNKTPAFLIFWLRKN